MTIYETVARELHHVEGEVRDHLPHLHHAQPAQEGTTMTTPIQDAPRLPTRIRAAIEADLTKAGKTVDADVHAILAHHLGLANFAGLTAHVAQLAAVLQQTPWLQVAEECLGLPPALVNIAASYAPAIARDLAHAGQPAPAPAADVLPQPEPAPAP